MLTHAQIWTALDRLAAVAGLSPSGLAKKSGLDPTTSVNIENLMIKLSRELKVTTVIVTHVMQTVYRAARRIVMLHDGKFIEVGSPDEARQARDPIVRKFITGGKE